MPEQLLIDGSLVKTGTFYGYHPNAFLQLVDKILSKGDRVELIPVKNGVKVMRVRREEIKNG
jgi:hypothetical protein